MRFNNIRHLCKIAGNMPNAALAFFEHSARFPDIEETEIYAITIKEFLL